MKNKVKKVRKLRGSHTHGYGSKKKHRGAGSRGGRGMAGSGKRADQKKPSILKKYGKKYFGRYGFRSLKKKIRAVNIDYLEKLVNKNLVKKEGDVFLIDLEKLGYEKLLSAGKVTQKFKVLVKSASKKAIEKIKKLGGEIIQPEKKG